MEVVCSHVHSMCCLIWKPYLIWTEIKSANFVSGQRKERSANDSTSLQSHLPPLTKLTELREPIFSSRVNAYCQKCLEWDSRDVPIKISIFADNKSQGKKNYGVEFANRIIFHDQFRRYCEILPGTRTIAVCWLSRTLPELLVFLF